MRPLLCALAFAATVSGASAAETCNRFVHETVAGWWIEEEGATLRWHKDGDTFTYKEIPVDGLPHRAAEFQTEDPLALDIVPFRFANVDGRETLIFGPHFYYRDCTRIVSMLAD